MFSRIKNALKQDKKIILVATIIGFIITCVFTFYTKDYSKNIQAGLAKSLIRFHVIANSDSPEDQKLKREVRDEILKNMKGILDKSNSIEETRKLINNNIDYITKISKNVVKKWGKHYDVKVALGQSIFPTKRYGDVVLPPGKYEALCVKIGQAKGQNWWCVMFPPLCFVDITHGVVPEETKDELKNILTDQEYKLILATRKDSDLPIKLKFKIVEWWENKYLNNNYHFAWKNK